MRAIHKRGDGLFLRSVAALLFLAVCAWCGAGLYARLRPQALPAASVEASAPVRRFAGICLRTEAPLYLPASAALALQAGERVPAGGLIARLPDGGEIRAERSALYLPDTDGWETLAFAASETLDAPALQSLLDREPPLPTGCRGRLVYESAWYFAALLPEGEPPPATGACRLRFEGRREWLPARLLRQSGTSEGGTLLLFRLTRGGDYLSLRRCEAELYEAQ